MKVIKQGEWKLRVTCRDCKSVLEVSREDITVQQQETDAHEFIPTYFVECPICSRENRVKVPRKVREEIDSEERIY